MTEQDKIAAEIQRNNERYLAAMHAVQSAIAAEIQFFGERATGADAKHLRTGINSCLVDSSAVAQLLIAKGVFTESEYVEAIANAAEREVESLTRRMREKTGQPGLSFA